MYTSMYIPASCVHTHVLTSTGKRPTSSPYIAHRKYHLYYWVARKDTHSGDAGSCMVWAIACWRMYHQCFCVMCTWTLCMIGRVPFDSSYILAYVRTSSSESLPWFQFHCGGAATHKFIDGCWTDVQASVPGRNSIYLTSCPYWLYRHTRALSNQCRIS